VALAKRGERSYFEFDLASTAPACGACRRCGGRGDAGYLHGEVEIPERWA